MSSLPLQLICMLLALQVSESLKLVEEVLLLTRESRSVNLLTEPFGFFAGGKMEISAKFFAPNIKNKAETLSPLLLDTQIPAILALCPFSAVKNVRSKIYEN